MRFVRRREMDAEVVWRAQSVASGWSGLPPFLTAEWSYSERHVRSPPGNETMPSRSRREENTEAVLVCPPAPDTDTSWAIVALVDAEALAEFLDRIEGLTSWDSGFGSIEESVTETVSIAAM